jgi:Ni/Fe-hydrogenase 1 B-type cytochrome subunit
MNTTAHPAAGAPPRAGPARVLEPSGRYRWVYLWGWPIRATHWTAVAAFIVLIITGFYIGRPYFIIGSGEASEHFFMGRVRLLHFAAAGVLVACGIIRVYWLFAGNRFERWRALFPVRKQDWAHLWQQVKYYLLIHPERAPHYLGHNPLQQFSYTALYAVVVVEILTGFALYAQAAPGGMWYRLVGWIVPLFGGIQIVRFVHHLLTWVFLIFAPIHIYLALRAEVLERSGTISSIISGGRFVRADVEYVDQPK